MGGTTMGSTSSGSSTTYSYCNVTVTYTHPGKDDTVVVKYAFPEPSEFESRFYVAGGGGYALNSDATGGLEYGAAAGATSAGCDALDYSYMDKVLTGNGSINWDATNMFGLEALGEMALLGKYLTKALYSMSDSDKLYTYYEGCSDGGREGMSQVQRWGTEYDGVIAGAPAFRFAQQQVLHVFPVTVEQTLDYYPNPCALDVIVNATISACDPLDGRTDGVVSRTDLCKLNFNLSSIIGTAYYCEGTSASSGAGGRGPSGSTTTSTYAPTQNGTISAQDIEVAQAIYDGLHNSAGQQAYLSWQIASSFEDAVTVWSNTSESWTYDIPSTGGEYVTRFVQLLNTTNLDNLDGVTYDTLVGWMDTAMIRYYNSLQTTLPDLSPFRDAGGKLLHYHGESDPSVPAASSAHYWQSVRSIMYGNLTDVEAIAEMQDWYQLYYVPGAAHCGTNTLQPGPYPEDNMAIMIDWVENGVQPSRLNATVSSGTYANETQLLCQWPTGPLWNSDTTFDCVTDNASIESWTYSFPAFDLPVY
ncbi:Tannase/feruloyl esterase [Exophiala viscosa]|uniref:Tannase/feruloyl esterase n=1 Tax=Exophiala viscosa TaxID=2486360 RepID=UPI00219CB04F|nr:Tannase/feruloyl esterase [Exophiala viscosa]